uniref:Uncharacterized protein n=1 Tax=Anguilla anguilla TaxID=7936 RepID=A0A0E9ULE1_ANGAN
MKPRWCGLLYVSLGTLKTDTLVFAKIPTFKRKNAMTWRETSQSGNFQPENAIISRGFWSEW